MKIRAATASPPVILGVLLFLRSCFCDAFVLNINNKNRRSAAAPASLVQLHETSAAAPSPGGFGSNKSQQQQEKPSSITSNSDTKNDGTKKRTLYEILGASPTATRAELKQQYVLLARKSHPDALIGSRATGSSTTSADDAAASPSLDFNEIATAWRILSDDVQRKRYDRSLKAEKLSVDIAAWAGDVFTTQAKPMADVTVELLEKFAIPLFRRTTATTLASFQAAAQELKKKPRRSSDPSSSQSSSSSTSKSSSGSSSSSKSGTSFRSTLKTAMDAAQRAGQAVEKMEMEEESEELQDLAVKEYQKAMDLKMALQAVVEQRLKLALHTPQSGLTSNEAWIVLEEFNQTVSDDVSLVQRALLMRHTVEEEITELQRTEAAFLELQKLERQADEDYRTFVQERLMAADALEAAQQQEIEARLAYERAVELVAQRQVALEEISQEMVNIEARANKCSYDMERKSALVMNQSEKVRNALRQKEKEVLRVQGGNAMSTAVRDTVSETEIQERMQRMEELRDQERRLSEQCANMEVSASRLLSRANKLKTRAEALST